MIHTRKVLLKVHLLDRSKTVLTDVNMSHETQYEYTFSNDHVLADFMSRKYFRCNLTNVYYPTSNISMIEIVE